jgi:hypothetical protein
MPSLSHTHTHIFSFSFCLFFQCHSGGAIDIAIVSALFKLTNLSALEEEDVASLFDRCLTNAINPAVKAAVKKHSEKHYADANLYGMANLFGDEDE